jgi:hypothetical protein
MSDLKFDEKAVKAAEEDYSKVKLDREQRTMLNAIAKIVYQFIPSLPERAIRGFMLRNIQSLQMDKKMTMANTINMTLQEQIDFSREGLDLLKGLLLNVLRDKSDDQVAILDEAFEKAMEYITEMLTKALGQ